MARGVSTFKQRDLRAAVKAVRDAGAEVTEVELRPDGTIKISTNNNNKCEIPTQSPTDELTKWLERHAGPA